jgi:D-lactate dehydrogenase (cytochrome)
MPPFIKINRFYLISAKGIFPSSIIMKKICGQDTIRRELPDILHDESRFESGVPSCVCFPESLADLQGIFREVSSERRGVTLVGGQTGTTGGAVPEEGNWAIAFSSMKRILGVSFDAEKPPVVLCEPGITLEELERFLRAPREWPYPVAGSDDLPPGGFFYPPDPTEMTAQLGGTVATNASGARSFRFGPPRVHVDSLLLVFASGDTVTVKRRKGEKPDEGRTLVTDQGVQFAIPPLPYMSSRIKNASGYFSRPDREPIDLFIGSEGTLATFAAVGVRVQPAVNILAGLSFFTSSGAAFDFADFLREETQIAAIEFFDGSSLRFLDRYRHRVPGSFPSFPKGAGSAVLWEFLEGSPETWESRMDKWEAALARCGASLEETWSGFEEAEKERLRRFRHALPETVNGVIAENKRSCKEIRKIGTDSALPADRFRVVYESMTRMIEKSGLASAAWGHLGDHHIHVNLIPSTGKELSAALDIYDECMSLAVENGGTVSAEHGIGKIKKKYLQKMYGREAVEAMRAVKTAFDPAGILNPGNLF